MSSAEHEARESVERRRIGQDFAHLWSDALFARSQARESEERATRSGTHPRQQAQRSKANWDRGSFVRWAVISASTALEMACSDAVEASLRPFYKALSAEMKSRGVALENDKQPWKDVWDVHSRRHKFVHSPSGPPVLFAELEEAERAIAVMRRAIIDIYQKVGKPYPLWVDCDDVPQVPGTGGWLSKVTASGKVDDRPRRVVAVFGASEFEYSCLGSAEDPWPEVRDLAENVRVPISEIRLYEGPDLVDSLTFQMRGGA